MKWNDINSTYPEQDTRCLVIYRGDLCIRVWNAHYQCWDDEEGDDYFCDKDKVEKWISLDKVESNITE